MHELEEYCKMKLYYESALKVLEAQLEIIKNELSIIGKESPINYTKTRIKSPSSILEKMHRKNIDFSVKNMEKLNDIVGARIVCNFLDDVFNVVNTIKKDNNLKIINEKDFIENPKPSGYRGYHIIVSIPITIYGLTKNVNAEIQIRTTAMDFWASNEHKLNYKSDKSSEKAKKQLLTTAESLWDMDVTMNDIYKENKTKEDHINVIKQINIISEIAKRKRIEYNSFGEEYEN